MQLFGTCVACFIVVGDQLPVVMAKAGWVTVNAVSSVHVFKIFVLILIASHSNCVYVPLPH